MKKHLFFLFAILNLAAALPALSQDNTAPFHEETTSPQPHHNNPFEQDIDHRALPIDWHEKIATEGQSFETKFFNMLFILGLLIAFMFIASWALKRMMRSKVTLMNTASTIKVVESRYLSPRATLHLVEVEDQHFLIAESPTTVSYLATLPQSKTDI